MISDIKIKYPELDVIDTKDLKFAEFGRILKFKKDDLDHIKRGHDYMNNNTIIPSEGNIYVASDIELEAIGFKGLIEEVFGQINIQCGYCNGKNTKLNALEYHKSPEVLVATTRCILLLGKPIDLNIKYNDDGDVVKATFNSKDCVALYLEEGEVIELYPRVLHFSPIKVDNSGFKVMIILPKLTNTPLEAKNDDRLLFMTNKWLIAHKERPDLIGKGAYHGLEGINYEIELEE